jgi:hypothetical protein
MGVTALDRFWAGVQLDLLDLPRLADTLERLESVNPELHLSLVKGEQWLLRPERTLEELQAGWGWWLRLYREAVRIVDARSGKLAG